MEETDKRSASDLEGDEIAVSHEHPTDAHAETTEADSIPLRSLLGKRLSLKTKNLKKELPNPGVSEDAEEYNMRHTKRGLALIFNHYEFDMREYPNGMKYKPANRDGTNKDRDKLETTFSDLGFEVECLQDKCYEEIEMKLGQVAVQDHSGCDCVAVIVLTHGEAGGKLDARDQLYDAHKLWEPFIARSSSSLTAKPKLFFIQACKGGIGDPGAVVKNCIIDSADASPTAAPSFRVPSFADILISYSTFEGYCSFRHTTCGSWYVQTLCAVLEKDAGSKDLVSLLTSVNRIVGQKFISFNPFQPSCNKKVQGPCFFSSLTRRVHFWPRVTFAGKATPTFA